MRADSLRSDARLDGTLSRETSLLFNHLFLMIATATVFIGTLFPLVIEVFDGARTNSRLEDMREAAAVVKKLGRKVARNVKLAMGVPGSGLVKEQAEREGLHDIFTAAGFEWREPGCSMCLAMNADRLEPGERCASTSNRNFEGRQGAGGRTHLVSPAMAAAAAVHGHFVDIRPFV